MKIRFCLLLRGGLGVCLFVLMLCATPVTALDSSNVLVLYNTASAEGTEIANYYAQVHPGVTLLGLDGVPVQEQVNWATYDAAIRQPVVAALNNSIDCIVTTKGLPLRLYNPRQAGDPSNWNVYSSLESELTRADTITTRTLAGNQTYFLPAPWGNRLALNPYCDVDGTFDNATYGMRLTSRLDGFTVQDVKGAIDRAQVAMMGSPGYSLLLDDDPNSPASLADRMELLRDQVLQPRGVLYEYDETNAFIQDTAKPVIGYVGHGTHGGAPGDYLVNPDTGLQFQAVPGSVFHTWESYNAYSFHEGGNHYGQGLVAEWIAYGGTAGVGHVEEPGANSANVTNEDRLFERLLDGYTWAEAAWGATLQCSFVNTFVGDPLMQWQFDTVSGDAFYTIWADTFGSTTDLRADWNYDGMISDADYTVWSDSYSSGTGSTAVPEPATMLLLAAGGIVALLRRRK